MAVDTVLPSSSTASHTPQAPTATPSVTGGSLTAGHGPYWYRVYALDRYGNSTLPGPEISVSIPSGTTGSVALSGAVPPGCVRVMVCRGDATTAEHPLAEAAVVGSRWSFTDIGSLSPSSDPLPVLNRTAGLESVEISLAQTRGAATTTVTGTGTTPPLKVEGKGSISLTVVTPGGGAWAGQVLASTDNGATWYPVSLQRQDGSGTVEGQSGSTASVPASTSRLWHAALPPGATDATVFTTSVTGSVTLGLSSSVLAIATRLVNVQGLTAEGSPPTGNPLWIAAKDPSGNLLSIQQDTSGNTLVNGVPLDYLDDTLGAIPSAAYATGFQVVPSSGSTNSLSVTLPSIAIGSNGAAVAITDARSLILAVDNETLVALSGCTAKFAVTVGSRSQQLTYTIPSVNIPSGSGSIPPNSHIVLPLVKGMLPGRPVVTFTSVTPMSPGTQISVLAIYTAAALGLRAAYEITMTDLVTISDTTADSVLPIPTSGCRYHITGGLVTNAHATQGATVKVTDGSGGKVIAGGYCAPAGGGFVVPFRPARGDGIPGYECALSDGATTGGIYAQADAVATIKVSLQGFIGPI